MKKFLVGILLLLSLTLFACGNKPPVPQSFDNPQAVIDYMLSGNESYITASTNGGDVSSSVRQDTAINGQTPYATVITCSDSRVPAEHIFNAGIGELFVIRTAGNVIGEFELGSVEYGAEHLGTKLILVLGHTQCGAVDAALSGGAHGYIGQITDEILSCLTPDCSPRDAEKLNVQNSISKIMQSEIMQELVNTNKVEVRGAIYDISSGKVTLMD